jgi:hypothetical protein
MTGLDGECRLGYSESSSSGRLASVPGMSRASASLSAMASSRRIRPAIASFVSGGSARAAS